MNRRLETVSFGLIDRDGNEIGEVHPEPGASVRVDTTARITRTLSGVSLPSDEAADIDIYSHRLKPVFTIDGVDYPLGVFLFSAAPKTRSSYGVELRGVSLNDRSEQIDQQLDQSFGVDTGDVIRDRLVDLIEAAAIVDYSIEGNPVTASDPLAWPAGASRADAVDHLLSLLGFVGYFDNNGTFTARTIPVPGIDPVMFDYQEGSDTIVVSDSITETDDLWEKPNVWVVVSTSATGSAVVGRYELPATSPLSQQNRGFPVTKVIELAGLTSTSAADAAAREASLRDLTAETVTLTTAPDPTHDTWDVGQWRGVDYLEQAWSLNLEPGGDHQHTLRRLYR